MEVLLWIFGYNIEDIIGMGSLNSASGAGENIAWISHIAGITFFKLFVKDRGHDMNVAWRR